MATRRFSVPLAVAILATAVVVIGLIAPRWPDLMPASPGDSAVPQKTPTARQTVTEDLPAPGRHPVEGDLAPPAKPIERADPSQLDGVDDLGAQLLLLDGEANYSKREALILRHRLAEFRALKSKSPFGLTEGLLIGQSIANILDAVGRYEQPGGSTVMMRSGSTGSHAFLHGNRVYRFGRGEFPEYDAWRDYSMAFEEYQKRVRVGDSSLREPEFDSSWFDVMERRAEEALATFQ